MKEIYSWVPWFRELSEKIAGNGEEYLVERAKRIAWKKDGSEPPLLRYGDNHIDPFSFVYSVASVGRQTAENRKRVFESVTDEFDLSSQLALEIDEAFIFPQPPPNATLFHAGGGGRPDLLRSLFRQAARGMDSINAMEFNKALQIKFVKITKLSHVLFLIKPDEFLPYDTMLSLGAAKPAKTSDENWDYYAAELPKIRDMFPGCIPYEINFLAYQVRKAKDALRVDPGRCFQISTNVYNDGVDRWEEFAENYWAVTGGPGNGVGWDEDSPEPGSAQYSLEEPRQGDILLVRFANQGRGIGVVYRNDYAESLTKDAKLHVLWMNKKHAALNCGPRGIGFGRGGGRIGQAFRDAYPETFQLLRHLTVTESNRNGGKQVLSKKVEVIPASSAHRCALNTILYGPPGTGKTYETVRRCVAICDGEILPEVDAVRDRYCALMEEGRVEFVTFHQSYGYEEFVEGLRPDTRDSGGAGFRLTTFDGVVKRIAERAREIPQDTGRRIFKMSLGDPRSWSETSGNESVFGECVDNGYVMLEYGGNIDWSDRKYDKCKEILDLWRTAQNANASMHDTHLQAMWRFRTEMRPGDIVVASEGYRHFRGIAEITGGYEFKPRDDGFHHRRPVRWHWHARGGEGHPVSVFKEGRFQWRPINWMTPANPAGLIPYLHGIQEFAGDRPHVLVIDEINRANISKVMGELITLLEEDKREGAENEVAVTLPYSGEQFTLPANLHIIGTMNTADRSIALLDTALRRRFRFEEITPDPEKLKDAGERTGVDLPGVLVALNERLEYLVDRDHLIGHAWFMDARTREDVDEVMRHRIIPLIAEYFYDDWSKVNAVLGGTGNFVTGDRLKPPPGLEDDADEDRFRWTVQSSFPSDAYEQLVEPGIRGEPSE